MSNARSFNGTSQRLTGAVTFLGAANTFTMMCWVKPASLSGTPQSVVFTLYTDASDRDCRMRFGWTVPATIDLSDSNDANYLTNSGLILPDTNWHHVGYRQGGGDNTYDKFLDGAKTVISTTFGANTILAIGAPSSLYVAERKTFGNFYGGAIAELAFWNVKLTDANIAAIAVATGTTRPSDFPTGLVGYWSLGLGDPEPDQSGGGASLTLTNAPTVVDGPYPPPNFGLPSSHTVPILAIQQW